MKLDTTILIAELHESQSEWIELTYQESKKQMGGVQTSKSQLSQSPLQVVANSELQISQVWNATRFGDIKFLLTITSVYFP